MSDETWAPIPEAEGKYEASTEGRIRNASTGQIRKPFSEDGRYSLRITVLDDDGRLVEKTRRVHQLVASAFLGPRPEGIVVRHLNDIPTDNRIENLAYGTRSDNSQDMLRNGGHHLAKRTHCPNGHEFTPENTYYRPSGGRVCRTCKSDWSRAKYASARPSVRSYTRKPFTTTDPNFWE